MKNHQTRGVTLIECLVVITIIAILIAILMPAIAGARSSSRRIASVSNLRSLTGVQATYSNEYGDSFINPFSPRTPLSYPGLVTPTGPASFSTVVLPQYAQTADASGALTLAFPHRTTEPFAHMWSSYAANYLHGVDRGLEFLRDPSDPVLARKASELLLAANQADGFNLFETSYWYPPVFWLASSRYASEAFQPVGMAESESRWLGRNRFADVTMPMHKVLLFERFDWSVRQRTSGPSGGTTKAPAQWNNPTARPHAAFVDGSVGRLRMGDLHALGESSDPSVMNRFRPSGNYDPPTGYALTWLVGPPIGPSTGTDPYETGSAPYEGTAAWRSYLYATRNGVRGVDVNSR